LPLQRQDGKRARDLAQARHHVSKSLSNQPLEALGSKTVESGLLITRADVYLYPLVAGPIIFLAASVDSLRHCQLLRLGCRKIRGAAGPET